MIIQTGMRTDIPAFYAEWFANRLREGYVCVRNPYEPTAVTRYSLSPDVVDLIAFCTKNPAPMFPYLNALEPYGQYWFVTVTPYGKEIEPAVPPKEQVLADVQCLSKRLGKSCVGWRYDPIFITETYTLERHIAEFESMASRFSGYVDTCVISFIDLYQKVKRNFPEVREVTAEERATIGREFVRIAKRYGITVKSCAEGNDLAQFGVDTNGCMTVETFERATQSKWKVPKRKSPRAECTCLLGNDIGMYDTCGHLCRYCYANSNAGAVCRNRKLHNPASPFLIGTGHPDDVIHEARQERWSCGQLQLF